MELYEQINKNQADQQRDEDVWAQGLMSNNEFAGRRLVLVHQFENLMVAYINAA